MQSAPGDGFPGRSALCYVTVVAGPLIRTASP
jgi:hypothetical protein